MSAKISDDTPVFFHPENHLIPVNDYLTGMMDIPASRMFLIKKSLDAFKAKYPDLPTYDASQGDGGASLPGVPPEILDRAAELQKKQGSAYDMPYGTDAYRKATAELYWKFDAAIGYGPTNIVGTCGGRDGLVKAYQAMLSLGYGRVGDLILVSRVPWISYNWGPYGIGANVLLAPGKPESGWGYTVEGIQESVAYAAKLGRKVAGMIITNPDNPTGRTISVAEQVMLAKAALQAGVAFVLFDWMYHHVTDEAPMNINEVLAEFTPEERSRLMFLDGLTKSLGASNIRNAHLVTSEKAAKHIIARASHTVMPTYYSLAVAMAAYEMGFENACRTIVEPTNASRIILKKYLEDQGHTFIIGKGYYAFIHVGPWLKKAGWEDTEPFGEYIAKEHGVAVVPGAYNSVFGGEWIRFSYATPPERTLAAAKRLTQALQALDSEK